MAGHCWRLNLVTRAPLQLVNDVMETQTIPACTLLFAFLEQHSALFTEGVATNVQRALPLLALVNALLRRLSKSTDAALCGRVRTFLANAIALTDRSGVNLTGATNANAAPQLDEGAPADDGLVDDVTMVTYKAFWGLQTAFANPRTTWEPAALNALLAVCTIYTHFCWY